VKRDAKIDERKSGKRAAKRDKRSSGKRECVMTTMLKDGR